jgi:hypothetical protein
MERFLSYLFPVIFLFCLSTIHAGERDKSRSDYQITKNEKDSSLGQTEVVFVFTFKNMPEETLVRDEIKAGCNGIEKTIKPDANGQYTVQLIPGEYKFQFFYNRDYYEIETSEIKADPAHRIEITINYRSTLVPTIMRKPVIYVYPTQTTQINIHLDLNGELLFTYPTYHNGWEFTADPNGKIHLDNREYNYLFWEGSTCMNATDINWDEGALVTKDNLLGFLEKSLTKMGLSTSEQQDFITYWYPLMRKNQKNYVHFMFNEEYSYYAPLSITPKPDHLFRVYMIWSDASKMEVTPLKEQVIPSFTREGFTVVEWGGSELSEIPPYSFLD